MPSSTPTMPRSRPATTGYERLAQADHSDDSDDDVVLAQSYASLQYPSAPRYAPISQPRPRSGVTSPRAGSRYKGTTRLTRVGSNSGVDLKAINARLERWADEIASRFKRRARGPTGEEKRLEIHHSVFQAPEGVRPITAEALAEPQPVMSKAEFDEIVNSVRTAIEQGLHPRMISQGSSGSYFARNTDGKVVGVFKPKDEEPYAAGNPKWNKWIHRNLFPCCFGRAWLVNFPPEKLRTAVDIIKLALFRISPTSARLLPTLSTVNCEHTLSHTQPLCTSPPSPSTTPSGTAGTSTVRRSPSLPNQEASRSSSTASRMRTYSCANIPGRISTGPVSGPTTLNRRRKRGGWITAAHLARRGQRTQIALMAAILGRAYRLVQITFSGQNP